MINGIGDMLIFDSYLHILEKHFHIPITQNDGESVSHKNILCLTRKSYFRKICKKQLSINVT